MDSQQLSVFVTLTKYENMSQAADILHTSQPQISKLLSSLESELQVRLFDRVGRGIRLNEHGRHFLTYAEMALDSMTAGRNAMTRLHKSLLGHVSFGVFAYGPILNECVLEFRRQNPEVSFHYSGRGGRSQLDPREIDILLCPIIDSHYHYENQYPIHHKILEEQYYILCSPSFPGCPVDRTELNATECAHLPFIIMGASDSYTATNDVSTLRMICNMAGVASPNIVYEVNEFSFKMLLVRAGEGMTLLPESCLDDARLFVPDLKIFRLKEMTPSREVILARKPDDTMTTVGLAFWEHAISYFNEHKR